MPIQAGGPTAPGCGASPLARKLLSLNFVLRYLRVSVSFKCRSICRTVRRRIDLYLLL